MNTVLYLMIKVKLNILNIFSWTINTNSVYMYLHVAPLSVPEYIAFIL